MNNYNRNRGLRGLMRSHRTPEEVKSDELQQFYKDHVENRKPYTKVASEVDTLDFPSVDLSTLKKTEVKPINKKEAWKYESWGDRQTEPRNKFGHTKAQKNKMINDYLTRPKATDQEIQNKEFWGAFNNSEKMVKYLKKYGEKEQFEDLQTPKKSNNTVTFDPTTQLFTNEKRDVAFKHYDKAKAYNDTLGAPTATPTQVNDLADRLQKSRQMTSTTPKVLKTNFGNVKVIPTPQKDKMIINNSTKEKK